MQRLCAVIGAVAVIAFGLLAGPASADPPEIVESSFTFVDVNPCTGEEHEITLNFVDRIHQHQNMTLVTSERSGTTDDGFVVRSGVETQVANGHVFHGNFVDNWVNPETGDRFQARGTVLFSIDAMEVRVDRFTLRCVGAPTVPRA